MNANDLIGTKHDPAGWGYLRGQGSEAFAYHELNPYPFFHFNDWKTEARGPLPKCLPLCRDIVRKGARWVFGKPVPIDVQDDEDVQEALREIWQANQMPARLVKMAEAGGVWGGQVLFFSFDGMKEQPVNIKVYNPSREARCYFDPDDRTNLLMLRLQYPFYDPKTGENYWYREDWTDDYRVTYEPNKVPNLTIQRPFDYVPDPTGEWREKSKEPNPFGLIPAWLVRNAETESPNGEGDLWRLFRVVDRVNLTFHLMDRSNQFDSEPNKIYIDANIPADDVDRPVAPGQAEAIATAGEGNKADVKLLEPRGALRPAMRDYAKDLMGMIRSAAGSVELDAETITNKGNLTRQVMDLMFSPLIEITDEKRKLYGEDGVGKFLERMSIGLAKVGHAPFNGEVDVTLRWPDYFPLSDEEKMTRVTLLNTEETMGYMSHERAVDKVASMEGIEDIKEFEAELEAETKARADVEAKSQPTDPEAVAQSNIDEMKKYAVKKATA